MAIRFGEGYFPSHNQVSQVYYCHYTPEMPKGVVLLIHGMGGHSGRYREFAESLCERGYAVYAYDLIGHGKSVGEGEDFGTFAEADGDIALVKDLETVTSLVRRRFRQLPFFAFAHSLGSFITRAFAATHPSVFDGILLSGTAEVTELSFFKKRKLKKLLAKARRAVSPEVERLVMGDLVKPFLNESGYWLTTRPESLASPESDPFIGHKMKADAYGDMIRLLEYISSDEWLEKMPHGTPILFLSGARDPLGGYGDGIRSLADQLLDDGFSKVSVKIYEGEKHELLGSLSHDTVISDVFAFLDEESDAVTAMRRQLREVF